MLEALTEHSPLVEVTEVHVDRALDDLLDSAQHVTRALLGVGVDREPAVSRGRAAVGHGAIVGSVDAGPTGTSAS